MADRHLCIAIPVGSFSNYVWLAISRSLIRLHGRFIEVRIGQVGRGSGVGSCQTIGGNNLLRAQVTLQKGGIHLAMFRAGSEQSGRGRKDGLGVGQKQRRKRWRRS